MAEYRRAEIVSGLFIVLSVLAFIVLALKVKGSPIPGIDRPGVKCEAVFWDVGPLDSAAKVTIGGYRVGTVTGIFATEAVITEGELANVSVSESRGAALTPGREHLVLKVEFTISDPSVRLAPDATATVQQEGFIGSWHLAVDPGTWDPSTKPLLVHERTDLPIRLKPARAETLKDLIPSIKPIMTRLDSILARIELDLLKPLLEGKQEQLGRIVPQIEGALTDVRSRLDEVRGLLDPNKPESPVKHLNKLLDDADLTVLDLKKKIEEELLPPLKLAIEDGKAALTAAKKTMEDASGALADARPRLKDLLENLKNESGRLEKRLDDVQKRLGALLDDARESVSLQQADLAVIVESFRNTAWEIEEAARKIRSNPAVMIFGDDEKGKLSAEPLDDSGLRKGGRAKPYEKRDETPAKKE